MPCTVQNAWPEADTFCGCTQGVANLIMEKLLPQAMAHPNVNGNAASGLLIHKMSPSIKMIPD